MGSTRDFWLETTETETKDLARKTVVQCLPWKVNLQCGGDFSISASSLFASSAHIHRLISRVSSHYQPLSQCIALHCNIGLRVCDAELSYCVDPGVYLHGWYLGFDGWPLPPHSTTQPRPQP